VKFKTTASAKRNDTGDIADDQYARTCRPIYVTDAYHYIS